MGTPGWACIPEAQRAQFAQTPIELMSDKAFARLTGSRRKGEAVVIIKDGKPTVIVRQGASPTALRREAAHLLQAVDAKKAPDLRSIDEARLANWHGKDVRERFRIYSDKIEIEIEIDAAHRDLDLLRAAAREPGAPPRVGHEIAEVENVLRALRSRREEVAAIGPLRRTLMAWGGTWFQPRYLEHPPRLFTKRAGLDKRELRSFIRRSLGMPEKIEVEVHAAEKTRWLRRESNYPLTDMELELLAHHSAATPLVFKTVGTGKTPAHVRIEVAATAYGPYALQRLEQGGFIRVLAD